MIEEPQKIRGEKETGSLEAFSDGVFAVAITYERKPARIVQQEHAHKQIYRAYFHTAIFPFT